MEDLWGLAGLGGDAPGSRNVCSSLDEVQRPLRDSITSSCTDTRARHISVTFELRYNTEFVLPEEPDSILTAEQSPQLLEQRPCRIVHASEVILNQPTDDPFLQRAVVKHIVALISSTDGNTWNVRQVSKTSQGWAFTYLCGHSLQSWNRQQAKSSDRPVIGTFSGYGGLDPVNLSRPAFDCRGTLGITFSKSSRAVVLNYEHTQLHKTVAELFNRIASTQPSLSGTPSDRSANNGNLGDNGTRTPKSKRPPPTERTESAKVRRKVKAKGSESVQTSREMEAEQTLEPQQAPSQPMLSGLNIPPAEATRRREVAAALLRSRDIEPSTLSEDQMNIFANQSPHLQGISLDMFAKYGAERLRIVHPEGKAQQATSSTSEQIEVDADEPST
ncbi:hypothetical protein BX600DRAFT_8442 [Xylariales sp. PMI_506]|nr:hypothetical protein BX600DRAFT_8442 [Xylariales sp. PMI_506]